MTAINTRTYRDAGMAVLTALICIVAPFNLSATVTATGLRVTHTGFVLNHSTNVWISTLKVTNQTSAPISGPVQVILTNLSPNAVMTNASSPQKTGNPSITLNFTVLAPGETFAVPIKFTNSSSGFITFTPVVTTVISGGNQ